MNILHPWEDPGHHGNSAKYHTGEACTEPGCDSPAGTVWSSLWCQRCNAKRLNRVGASFVAMQRMIDEANAAALKAAREANK